MTVNTDRLWFVTEQIIGTDRWTRKVGTLAGCLVDDPHDLRRLMEVLRSDTRDVLVMAPTEMVVAQPKAANKIGLLAGLRAARGNTAQLGGHVVVPKSEIRSIEMLDHIPDARIEGLSSVRLSLSGSSRRHSLVFAIDRRTLAPDAFQATAEAWLAGG